MRRSVTPLLIAFLLCACGSKLDTQIDAEVQAILAAVFDAQPDIPAQIQKFNLKHPEDRYDQPPFFDQRLCVASEMASTIAGFRMAVAEGLLPSGGRDIWANAARRTKIPPAMLPKHLRWDGPFRSCDNGVLRLTHPSIDKDTAEIFIANECLGWCGYGELVSLRRTKKGWIVTDKDAWWMS